MFVSVYLCVSADSPGVPPSANAHQLFRGFSFVASNLGQEPPLAEIKQTPVTPIVQVSMTLRTCIVFHAGNHPIRNCTAPCLKLTQNTLTAVVIC